MILARHGQSEFNVHFDATRTDPGIVDPALTELGRTQASAIAAAFAAAEIRPRVRLLIASPYRRTLETAEIVAARLDVPISVEPLVREHAAFTCDIGSHPEELARRWPRLAFDHLEDRWWGNGEESETALASRCSVFRAAMAARADWRDIAIITHWGFIRALTGQPIQNGAWLAFDPTA